MKIIFFRCRDQFFTLFFIKICHKKIWHLPKPFLGVDENWKKKKKIQKYFMIIICLLNKTINFAKLFYVSNFATFVFSKQYKMYFKQSNFKDQ